MSLIKPIGSPPVRYPCFYERQGVAPTIYDRFNPLVVYSMRKTLLSQNRCIRIRRDSDNAEIDVGFSGGWVDEQAIKDFGGGASDCFVTTCYGVAGQDATQTTEASQPKIYDVATGEVTKENGKPAMVFNGTNDNLVIPNIAGRSNIDAYFVTRHDFGTTEDTNTSSYIYPSIGNSLGGTYGFVGQKNATTTIIKNNYGNPNLYKNNILFTATTRDDVYNFLGQTQNIVNHQGADVSVWSSFNFGNFINIQFYFEGKLQELAVFDGTLSTQQRVDLHEDINNKFNIY